jgi:endonuclease/exonuclease/phosphatase family metal-dependent hydrolase
MEPIETGPFSSSESMESLTTLRVVSWNIARGAKLDAIIEFLLGADADIIFLQEVDRNARRTSYRNVAREIAQNLRLNYVFGCEFEELAQGSRASPAYHGQATLSRWPLSDSSILRFHSQSNFWQPRWFIPSLRLLQRRRGGRMALLNNVLIPGRTMATYNLHCESKGSDSLRYRQLHEFLQHSNGYSLDVPVVAAGDFNFDLSHGEGATALAKVGFVNPFATLHEVTTISDSLSARERIIDWILLRGPLTATNPQVHSSVVASDHYPLSLTVGFS